jgi:hypothetical protein
MCQPRLLGFLGWASRGQHLLRESHGGSPVSVFWDNTTLEQEDLCGHLSAKTVRSIVLKGCGNYTPMQYAIDLNDLQFILAPMGIIPRLADLENVRQIKRPSFKTRPPFSE